MKPLLNCSHNHAMVKFLFINKNLQNSSLVIQAWLKVNKLLKYIFAVKNMKNWGI